jgi:type IV pilus assembly protein PilN
MTRINLLDWRAERRELRKRQFMAMLGIAGVVAVVTLLIAAAIMSHELSYQQQRNQFIKQQIADIDRQIKEIQDLEKVKANLLSRMKVVESLQQSRSATVHFFDEIVNTLPDGVFLTAIKQSGNDITIDGVAESNGRVSAYMKNLDASPWFADPQLVVIKTGEANRQRSSTFTLKVRNLTKATDGGSGTAQGAKPQGAKP